MSNAELQAVIAVFRAYEQRIAALELRIQAVEEKHPVVMWPTLIGPLGDEQPMIDVQLP